MGWLAADGHIRPKPAITGTVLNLRFAETSPAHVAPDAISFTIIHSLQGMTKITDEGWRNLGKIWPRPVLLGTRIDDKRIACRDEVL